MLGVSGRLPDVEVLASATEQDMLDAFLEAEGSTRGYDNRGGLFYKWPEDCSWTRVSLSAEELERVHLIRNERSWIEIAGVDRTPGAAVEWVRSHAHDETALVIDDYHRRFVAGELPAPIIVVGPPEPTPEDLVVLEGNKRTVAAAMGRVRVDSIPFLLGTSTAMREWLWYEDGLEGGPH